MPRKSLIYPWKTWKISDHLCIGLFCPKYIQMFGLMLCMRVCTSIVRYPPTNSSMLRTPFPKFTAYLSSLLGVLEVFSLPPLSYVLKVFSSLFVSQLNIRVYLVRSNFGVIPDLIASLTCFLLTTTDLIIPLRIRICFFLLSS